MTREFQPIGALPPGHLAQLFEEEEAMWARNLSWDFGPTRWRLEAALRDGTLSGLVAHDTQGPCAYATYAVNEGQGVVGSIFASERRRADGLEDLLARRILIHVMASHPRVIDCQTLFSSMPGLEEPFSSLGFKCAIRTYMVVNRGSGWTAPKEAWTGIAPRPVQRTDLFRLARLVHSAHRETRDLDASSSFDSVESCERILGQITGEDICGPFDSSGSCAVDRNGELLAVCLLTWPLPGVAHVSEVATAPAYRGRGLARLCLTRTLRHAFERGGARAVTLSVTASNRAAMNLYESVGFVSRLEYRSHVLRRSPSS